ncbi:hypothetical protein VTK73DRAFT_8831 [Phialemonium thermophilum]|uniref:Uncharacterized protein n=1 Tax=Phialemonium thermophilum TaxID=223376 RepID=A0ABR3W628_9PEZI
MHKALLLEYLSTRTTRRTIVQESSVQATARPCQSDDVIATGDDLWRTASHVRLCRAETLLVKIRGSVSLGLHGERIHDLLRWLDLVPVEHSLSRSDTSDASEPPKTLDTLGRRQRLHRSTAACLVLPKSPECAYVTEPYTARFFDAPYFVLSSLAVS